MSAFKAAALFAIYAIALLSFAPPVYAVGTQADKMCSAGDYECDWGDNGAKKDEAGVKCMRGAPCQDTTSGCTTKGSCVDIEVCGNVKKTCEGEDIKKPDVKVDESGNPEKEPPKPAPSEVPEPLTPPSGGVPEPPKPGTSLPIPGKSLFETFQLSPGEFGAPPTEGNSAARVQDLFRQLQSEGQSGSVQQSGDPSQTTPQRWGIYYSDLGDAIQLQPPGIGAGAGPASEWPAYESTPPANAPSTGFGPNQTPEPKGFFQSAWDTTKNLTADVLSGTKVLAADVGRGVGSVVADAGTAVLDAGRAAADSVKTWAQNVAETGFRPYWNELVDQTPLDGWKITEGPAPDAVASQQADLGTDSSQAQTQEPQPEPASAEPANQEPEPAPASGPLAKTDAVAFFSETKEFSTQTGIGNNPTADNIDAAKAEIAQSKMDFNKGLQAFQTDNETLKADGAKFDTDKAVLASKVAANNAAVNACNQGSCSAAQIARLDQNAAALRSTQAELSTQAGSINTRASGLQTRAAHLDIAANDIVVKETGLQDLNKQYSAQLQDAGKEMVEISKAAGEQYGVRAYYLPTDFSLKDPNTPLTSSVSADHKSMQLVTVFGDQTQADKTVQAYLAAQTQYARNEGLIAQREQSLAVLQDPASPAFSVPRGSRDPFAHYAVQNEQIQAATDAFLAGDPQLFQKLNAVGLTQEQLVRGGTLEATVHSLAQNSTDWKGIGSALLRGDVTGAVFGLGEGLVYGVARNIDTAMGNNEQTSYLGTFCDSCAKDVVTASRLAVANDALIVGVLATAPIRSAASLLESAAPRAVDAILGLGAESAVTRFTASEGGVIAARALSASEGALAESVAGRIVRVAPFTEGSEAAAVSTSAGAEASARVATVESARPVGGSGPAAGESAAAEVTPLRPGGLTAEAEAQAQSSIGARGSGENVVPLRSPEAVAPPLSTVESRVATAQRTLDDLTALRTTQAGELRVAGESETAINQTLSKLDKRISQVDDNVKAFQSAVDNPSVEAVVVPKAAEPVSAAEIKQLQDGLTAVTQRSEALAAQRTNEAGAMHTAGASEAEIKQTLSKLDDQIARASQNAKVYENAIADAKGQPRPNVSGDSSGGPTGPAGGTGRAGAGSAAGDTTNVVSINRTGAGETSGATAKLEGVANDNVVTQTRQLRTANGGTIEITETFHTPAARMEGALRKVEDFNTGAAGRPVAANDNAVGALRPAEAGAATIAGIESGTLGLATERSWLATVAGMFTIAPAAAADASGIEAAEPTELLTVENPTPIAFVPESVPVSVGEPTLASVPSTIPESVSPPSGRALPTLALGEVTPVPAREAPLLLPEITPPQPTANPSLAPATPGVNPEPPRLITLVDYIRDHYGDVAAQRARESLFYSGDPWSGLLSGGGAGGDSQAGSGSSAPQNPWSQPSPPEPRAATVIPLRPLAPTPPDVKITVPKTAPPAPNQTATILPFPTLPKPTAKVQAKLDTLPDSFNFVGGDEIISVAKLPDRRYLVETPKSPPKIVLATELMTVLPTLEKVIDRAVAARAAVEPRFDTAAEQFLLVADRTSAPAEQPRTLIETLMGEFETALKGLRDAITGQTEIPENAKPTVGTIPEGIPVPESAGQPSPASPAPAARPQTSAPAPTFVDRMLWSLGFQPSTFAEEPLPLPEPGVTLSANPIPGIIAGLWRLFSAAPLPPAAPTPAPGTLARSSPAPTAPAQPIPVSPVPPPVLARPASDIIPEEQVEIGMVNDGKLVVGENRRVPFAGGYNVTSVTAGLRNQGIDPLLLHLQLGRDFDPALIQQDMRAKGALILKTLPNGDMGIERVRYRSEAGDSAIGGRVHRQSTILEIPAEAWYRNAELFTTVSTALRAEPDSALKINVAPEVLTTVEHEIPLLNELDPNTRYLADLISSNAKEGTVVPSDKFSDEKSFLEAFGRAVEALYWTDPSSVADLKVTVGIVKLSGGWIQFNPSSPPAPLQAAADFNTNLRLSGGGVPGTSALTPEARASIPAQSTQTNPASYDPAYDAGREEAARMIAAVKSIRSRSVTYATPLPELTPFINDQIAFVKEQLPISAREYPDSKIPAELQIRKQLLSKLEEQVRQISGSGGPTYRESQLFNQQLAQLLSTKKTFRRNSINRDYDGTMYFPDTWFDADSVPQRSSLDILTYSYAEDFPGFVIIQSPSGEMGIGAMNHAMAHGAQPKGLIAGETVVDQRNYDSAGFADHDNVHVVLYAAQYDRMSAEQRAAVPLIYDAFQRRAQSVPDRMRKQSELVYWMSWHEPDTVADDFFRDNDLLIVAVDAASIQRAYDSAKASLPYSARFFEGARDLEALLPAEVTRSRESVQEYLEEAVESYKTLFDAALADVEASKQPFSYLANLRINGGGVPGTSALTPEARASIPAVTPQSQESVNPESQTFALPQAESFIPAPTVAETPAEPVAQSPSPLHTVLPTIAALFAGQPAFIPATAIGIVADIIISTPSEAATVAQERQYLANSKRDLGKIQTGIASRYNLAARDSNNPSDTTASGAILNATEFTVAMLGGAPKYAWGTKIAVKNVETLKDGKKGPNWGKEVIVVVNNTGSQPNRHLDLSPAAARALGITGTARVQFSVIEAPGVQTARYKLNRTDLRAGAVTPAGTLATRVAQATRPGATPVVRNPVEQGLENFFMAAAKSGAKPVEVAQQETVPSEPLTGTGGDQSARREFQVATQDALRAAGVPARFIGKNTGMPITVTFEEMPKNRWDSSQGSFPQYIAETLAAVGDPNAKYLGNGRIQITNGPRQILLDTLVTFNTQLQKEGLVLNYITLARDDVQNKNVAGDQNSDHKIGFAADGNVTVRPCSSGDTACAANARVLNNNQSERHLRILRAAHAAGVQQLNMYGKLPLVAGESLHIGMSPFRNGAPGETLSSGVNTEGVRRMGYGDAQRGQIAKLSPSAARYPGMQEAFDRMLHNPPPLQYTLVYDAIRRQEGAGLKTIVADPAPVGDLVVSSSIVTPEMIPRESIEAPFVLAPVDGLPKLIALAQNIPHALQENIPIPYAVRVIVQPILLEPLEDLPASPTIPVTVVELPDPMIPAITVGTEIAQTLPAEMLDPVVIVTFTPSVASPLPAVPVIMVTRGTLPTLEPVFEPPVLVAVQEETGKKTVVPETTGSLKSLPQTEVTANTPILRPSTPPTPTFPLVILPSAVLPRSPVETPTSEKRPATEGTSPTPETPPLPETPARSVYDAQLSTGHDGTTLADILGGWYASAQQKISPWLNRVAEQIPPVPEPTYQLTPPLPANRSLAPTTLPTEIALRVPDVLELPFSPLLLESSANTPAFLNEVDAGLQAENELDAVHVARQYVEELGRQLTLARLSGVYVSDTQLFLPLVGGSSGLAPVPHDVLVPEAAENTQLELPLSTVPPPASRTGIPGASQLQSPAVQKISDIEPIEKSGLNIATRAGIKDVAEAPLVLAIEDLWDKNIQTTGSSANKKNIREGRGTIEIDYATLSEENKTIGRELGTRSMMQGKEILIIDIPVYQNSTVREVEHYAGLVASEFEKQPLTWGYYTLGELRQGLGLGPDDTSVGVEDFMDSYPYDPTTKRFYWSEELARKANASVAPTAPVEATRAPTLTPVVSDPVRSFNRWTDRRGEIVDVEKNPITGVYEIAPLPMLSAPVPPWMRDQEAQMQRAADTALRDVEAVEQEIEDAFAAVTPAPPIAPLTLPPVAPVIPPITPAVPSVPPIVPPVVPPAGATRTSGVPIIPLVPPRPGGGRGGGGLPPGTPPTTPPTVVPPGPGGPPPAGGGGWRPGWKTVTVGIGAFLFGPSIWNWWNSPTATNPDPTGGKPSGGGQTPPGQPPAGSGPQPPPKDTKTAPPVVVKKDETTQPPPKIERKPAVNDRAGNTNTDPGTTNPSGSGSRAGGANGSTPSASGSSSGGGLGGMLNSLGGMLGQLMNKMFGNQQQVPQLQIPQPLKPVVRLIANPDSVAQGGKARLSWSSVGVTYCGLFGPLGRQIAEGRPDSSTSTPALATTTVFMVNCSAPSGATTSAQTSVRVR
ncbi:hypothetical protein A2851_03890 [Candidatus Kaiserbacteria bacterium RIFCSPHIGHO2_01_FULL_53_29]|uniref:Uncharacterized protein n=1 Tax=Candidatus Kaiserbacteria bacterium RIFCSPHIGHO2_01_FULL_53_29 TaxID=1798480 RepID=A0A1F6CWM7_9BACT|nr:MAG: hypothetical protein A2851_03890 [Candidatus Kaiserbacteria bacterium RIFCSPHIGHO2_01_FULL_53_29]